MYIGHSEMHRRAPFGDAIIGGLPLTLQSPFTTGRCMLAMILGRVEHTLYYFLSMAAKNVLAGGTHPDMWNLGTAGRRLAIDIPSSQIPG